MNMLALAWKNLRRRPAHRRRARPVPVFGLPDGDHGHPGGTRELVCRRSAGRGTGRHRAPSPLRGAGCRLRVLTPSRVAGSREGPLSPGPGTRDHHPASVRRVPARERSGTRPRGGSHRTRRARRLVHLRPLRPLPPRRDHQSQHGGVRSDRKGQELLREVVPLAPSRLRPAAWVIDPKGEYGPLAEAWGVAPVGAPSRRTGATQSARHRRGRRRAGPRGR